MTREFDATDQTARYAPLGLIGNPFFGSGGYKDTLEGCEIVSESHLLLGALVESAREEAPRPIWISKNPDYPASYSLAAEARVEEIISNDDGLNMLHAYTPLFAMKSGAVRSVLRLLGERLTFRDFERTLAAYVQRVLDEPDTELPSYTAMGPDALAEFATAFAEDPIAAVNAAFGEPEDERKAEFAEVTDLRQIRFDGDNVELGPAEDAELDETVGNAPGTGVVAEGEERPEAPYAAVVDYIIDYTREHLSPVMGRALRVYAERGLIATAAEFNITKAPRKTFASLVRFARARFDQIVLMWDGFENWNDIEPELRSKIVGLLSELRWSVDGLALPVFMIEEGNARELEESFASATKLRWDYTSFEELGENPASVKASIVDRWFANAAAPGATPLTLADPSFTALAEVANDDITRFIRLAREAIEQAADKGASSVSEEDVAAAIAVIAEEDAETTEAD